MTMIRPPESLAWCARSEPSPMFPFSHRKSGLLHRHDRTFAQRKTLKINGSRVIRKDFCIPPLDSLKESIILPIGSVQKS